MAEMSKETEELIIDTFKIVDSLTEEQKKDLLSLFLVNYLRTDPEKAMELIVAVREKSRKEDE